MCTTVKHHRVTREYNTQPSLLASPRDHTVGYNSGLLHIHSSALQTLQLLRLGDPKAVLQPRAAAQGAAGSACGEQGLFALCTRLLWQQRARTRHC